MSGKAEQLGMFGVRRDLGVHTVSAHTRVLADGTETHVAEHQRWSRGRTTRRAVRRPKWAADATSVEQLPLFGEPS